MSVRAVGGQPESEREYHKFGAAGYEEYLCRAKGNYFPVNQEGQHWYRGPLRALWHSLAQLLRPLELRRHPRAGDDHATLVHGMVQLTMDEFKQLVARVQTYEDVKSVFRSYVCFAASIDPALSFMRRWVGHVLANVQGRYFVFARREQQRVGQSSFMPVIYDDVCGDVPKFTWRVCTPTHIYGVCFDSTFALDSAFEYESVVSHITNPISRSFRPLAIAPNALNIGGRMSHVAGLLAKYAHTDPDRQAERLDAAADEAFHDPDVHAVLNHMVDLMRTSDRQSDDVKKMHKEAGEYLRFSIAWVIQNPDMRSTLILIICSLAQQSGKSTIYVMLRALLGYRLVVSLPVNQLNDRFMSLLAGALFLYIDEGASALEKFLDMLKTFTGLETITLQAKGKDMVTVSNVITMIITSNNISVPMAPTDMRVKPYFSPGLRQNDVAYFNRLYDLLRNNAVMERVFLVFSRMKMTVDGGEEYRPTSSSKLGRAVMDTMTNPRMIRIYREMGEVIDRCMFEPITSNEFMIHLLRIVSREFVDTEAKQVAHRVFADLRMRNILYETDNGQRVGSHLSRPVTCVPDPITFGKRPRQNEKA